MPPLYSKTSTNLSACIWIKWISLVVENSGLEQFQHNWLSDFDYTGQINRWLALVSGLTNNSIEFSSFHSSAVQLTSSSVSYFCSIGWQSSLWLQCAEGQCLLSRLTCKNCEWFFYEHNSLPFEKFLLLSQQQRVCHCGTHFCSDLCFSSFFLLLFLERGGREKGRTVRLLAVMMVWRAVPWTIHAIYQQALFLYFVKKKVLNFKFYIYGILFSSLCWSALLRSAPFHSICFGNVFVNTYFSSFFFCFFWPCSCPNSISVYISISDTYFIPVCVFSSLSLPETLFLCKYTCIYFCCRCCCCTIALVFVCACILLWRMVCVDVCLVCFISGRFHE